MKYLITILLLFLLTSCDLIQDSGSSSGGGYSVKVEIVQELNQATGEYDIYGTPIFAYQKAAQNNYSLNMNVGDKQNVSFPADVTLSEDGEKYKVNVVCSKNFTFNLSVSCSLNGGMTKSGKASTSAGKYYIRAQVSK